MEGNKMCSCPHHKVVPICITLIGLVIFAAQMNWLAAGIAGAIWPVLLVVIGLTKMMKCGCC